MFIMLIIPKVENTLTRTITGVETLYEKPEYSVNGYIHLRPKDSRLRTKIIFLSNRTTDI